VESGFVYLAEGSSNARFVELSENFANRLSQGIRYRGANPFEGLGRYTMGQFLEGLALPQRPQELSYFEWYASGIGQQGGQGALCGFSIILVSLL